MTAALAQASTAPAGFADGGALLRLLREDRIDALILDLDGTLRCAGQWLEGAVELLSELERTATPSVVLTNDASAFAHEKAALLRECGATFSEEQVLTCADLTIVTMRQRGWSRADVMGRLGASAGHDLDLRPFDAGRGLTEPVLILGSGATLSDELLTAWCRRPPEHCLVANADLVWLPSDACVSACPGLVGHALAALASAMGQRVSFTECGKPSVSAFEHALERLSALWRRPFLRERVAVFGDSAYSDITPAARLNLVPVQARTGLWRFHGK